MANQMVCDYLESMPHFAVDVAFQIENDEVTFHYCLQNGDFSYFTENANQENTGYFILSNLADEISLTSGLDTLTITFHVKTRITIQRQFVNQQVRSHILNS